MVFKNYFTIFVQHLRLKVKHTKMFSLTTTGRDLL